MNFKQFRNGTIILGQSLCERCYVEQNKILYFPLSLVQSKKEKTKYMQREALGPASFRIDLRVLKSKETPLCFLSEFCQISAYKTQNRTITQHRFSITHPEMFTLKSFRKNQTPYSFRNKTSRKAFLCADLKVELREKANFRKKEIQKRTSNNILSGEVFKESFTDILQTSLEQVGFSLKLHNQKFSKALTKQSFVKSVPWKKLQNGTNRRFPYFLQPFFSFPQKQTKTKNKNAFFSWSLQVSNLYNQSLQIVRKQARARKVKRNYLKKARAKSLNQSKKLLDNYKSSIGNAYHFGVRFNSHTLITKSKERFPEKSAYGRVRARGALENLLPRKMEQSEDLYGLALRTSTKRMQAILASEQIGDLYPHTKHKRKFIPRTSKNIRFVKRVETLLVKRASKLTYAHATPKEIYAFFGKSFYKSFYVPRTGVQIFLQIEDLHLFAKRAHTCPVRGNKYKTNASYACKHAPLPKVKGARKKICSQSFLSMPITSTSTKRSFVRKFVWGNSEGCARTCNKIALTIKIGDYLSSGDIIGEKTFHKKRVLQNNTSLSAHHSKLYNTFGEGVDALSQNITQRQKISTAIILGFSGRVVTISKTQVVVQKTQPVLFYKSAHLHVKKGNWVKQGSPILTLTHQTLITGDIVQGIPRIEQLFEAFTSAPPAFKEKGDLTKFKDGYNTLHSQVRDIFRNNWLKNRLPIAVRKSLEEIGYILVEMIQKVYLSQGVLIADKHIEIIVRQIASKGQILDSGTTGLFLEEVLPIRQIENANLTTPGKKCLYVPAVMGLTAAALNSDSFISAASFQETTRVLSRDAVVGKSDFLRGLKEKVVIGDLISAGTGLDLYFIYTTMPTG